MKHPLEEVKWGIIPITVYKGVLVEKIIGGYKLLHQTCIKPEEVDTIIFESQKSISKSIR